MNGEANIFAQPILPDFFFFFFFYRSAVAKCVHFCSFFTKAFGVAKIMGV